MFAIILVGLGELMVILGELFATNQPVSVITESSPIYSTVIPQLIPSFTPPPPQSTPTPPPTTEEVAELKKDDPLKTQVTSLVDEHLDVRLGATRDEFMNFLSVSITARITEQVKNQLPQILPKEVSYFAPPVIQRMITESLDHAILAKESSQPQSSYEAAALLTEFELKKILINKMDKSESYLAAPEHKECYDGLIKSYELEKTLFSTYDKSGSSKGTKSQPKSSGTYVQSGEPEFEVADSDMPQDQEENPGNDDEEPKGKETLLELVFKLLKGTRSNYVELEIDFEECYKPLSEKLDWENQKAGISHWRDQRKSFYGYAKGLELRHDVYSTKRILAVTRVEVMRKYGYGYLREIEVRRADNDLYTFNEGDFPRLHINDIEDMLILIVQNQLTNLSGDDVSDFAIALKMFTRSIVIQKRVEYLQLADESYQKKINVTKPETIKPDIRKKDPYTPYQDPQGFIYVDTLGRNSLI
nr:hypothetical protein [Tanacetum cinerariifolium]